MSDENRTDVTVNLMDVYGKTINDKVEIIFYNQNVSSLSQKFQVKFQGQPVVLNDVPAFPTGLAKVVITPTNYRSKAIFKNVIGGQDNTISEQFFVAPDKARPKLIDFSDISDKSYGEKLNRILDESEIGANAWNSLDKRNRATILNLSAKILEIEKKFGLQIFNSIQKIESDLLNTRNRARIYARVDANLFDRINNAPQVFDPAPGVAHHFPQNWHPFENNSFKARNKAGNIQFTFATNNDGLFLADIDLDDHTGIKHAFDVIKHTLTNEDSDPYDLHEILRYSQGIDPEYLLL